MKTNVIILAGGIGTRMNSNTPKQFIEVDGVPIIVHTINNFIINKNIDEITIVCVKDYIDELKKLIKQYNLYKVTNIVEGGQTGHDSTRNGIFSLKDKLNKDDFVIIHDAVRPLLPQKIIDMMVETAKEKGNACLAIPCYETVVCTNDKVSGNKEIDRNSFLRVQTPQMYRYQDILEKYEQAEKDNLHNFIYANTLFIHYGGTIYFSPGFNCNYKITTKEDITLYRALLTFNEDELMKR